MRTTCARGPVHAEGLSLIQEFRGRTGSTALIQCLALKILLETLKSTKAASRVAEHNAEWMYACNSNVTSMDRLIAGDDLFCSSLITPYASYWNCTFSSWLDSLGTKWRQEFFIRRPHSMETVEPLKNLRSLLWCYCCMYEQLLRMPVWFSYCYSLQCDPIYANSSSSVSGLCLFLILSGIFIGTELSILSASCNVTDICLYIRLKSWKDILCYSTEQNIYRWQ